LRPNGILILVEATKNATPNVVSAAPAGTILRGLNYLKNKQDPVALEDHEYPAWLWTVLAEKKGDGISGEDVGDEYCMLPCDNFPSR